MYELIKKIIEIIEKSPGVVTKLEIEFKKEYTNLSLHFNEGIYPFRFDETIKHEEILPQIEKIISINKKLGPRFYEYFS